MLIVPVQLLGSAERGAVQRLLDGDPIGGAQVAEQVAAGGLSRWSAQAQVFGYAPDRELESICWLGANLIPVCASAAAISAFADFVLAAPRVCSSLIGEAGAVLRMWRLLEHSWGPAREVRPCQPLLVTSTPPSVPADPAVRLVRPHESEALFPAAVAMYTEEVGVSPLAGGGGREYRRRVFHLVKARRSYAKFVGGQVVFKAELAVVTRHTAQVQGVWVAPEWRGRGIGTVAMAAVVRDALARVAPTVSLYVNDYNTAARRVYTRCGFKQVGTFATVLR